MAAEQGNVGAGGHTFGGRFERFVDFETDEFGGGGDLGGEAPHTPAESAPAETAPETLPGEAAAWGGPSQEDWGRITQYVEQTSPLLGQLGEILYEEPQQQEPPEFNPDNPEQWMQQRLEAMFQERFGAFEPVLGQFAEQQGEKIARETLAGLEGEVGKFDHDEAILRAKVFMSEGLEPRQALREAATQQFKRESALRQSAVEDYKRSLTEAANAPVVPGAVAGAPAVDAPVVPTGTDRYTKAVSGFFERRQPVSPADVF